MNGRTGGQQASTQLDKGGVSLQRPRKPGLPSQAFTGRVPGFSFQLQFTEHWLRARWAPGTVQWLVLRHRPLHSLGQEEAA